MVSDCSCQFIWKPCTSHHGCLRSVAHSRAGEASAQASSRREPSLSSASGGSQSMRRPWRSRTRKKSSSAPQPSAAMFMQLRARAVPSRGCGRGAHAIPPLGRRTKTGWSEGRQGIIKVASPLACWLCPLFVPHQTRTPLLAISHACVLDAGHEGRGLRACRRGRTQNPCSSRLCTA